MKINIKLLIALLIMITGCASPPRISLNANVSISPDFNDMETEMVIQAINDWHDQTGGKVNLKATISNSSAELVIRPGYLDEYRGWTESEGSNAVITLDTRWIVADRLTPIVGEPAAWHDCTLHEIGHALGLEHKENTLMRSAGFGGGSIDSETLHQFISLRF